MAWAWLWWHGGKGKEKGTRGERWEVSVTVFSSEERQRGYRSLDGMG